MTAALHTVRSWLASSGSTRVPRLVKVDLTIAMVALAVIIAVAAADHVAQGNVASLAGLLGV